MAEYTAIHTALAQEAYVVDGHCKDVCAKIDTFLNSNDRFLYLTGGGHLLAITKPFCESILRVFKCPPPPERNGGMEKQESKRIHTPYE